MKRFILLLGVVALLLGLKLKDKGLLRVANDGVFYHQTEQGFTVDNPPLFYDFNVYQRYDVTGIDVTDAIKKMRARVLFKEEIEEVEIYYCYSPHLKKSVLLKGRVVNLMIAKRQNDLVLGSPIIKGWY